MDDNNLNTYQTEIDNLLASLGIIMPRNEEELDKILSEEYIDTPELVDFRVDAEAIIRQCKEEESPKPILRYAAEPNQKYKKQPNKAFMRIVLAAEITAQLYNEPTFGHVKFQKLIYLCENAVRLDFNHRYSKQAAGPFDNKFMHSIDAKFIEKKWFNVDQEKKGYFKITYSPGENFNGHKDYFHRYYSQNNDTIQGIIDVFRKAKTRSVELIATLYFCWQELLDNDELINNEVLTLKVYAWSKEKQKYNQDEIDHAIKWMKKCKIHP